MVAAGSFLAGSWVTHYGDNHKATVERKILHYVDPMNPSLKSDKPGIAPCGMALVPVYADQSSSAADGNDLRGSMPPGTVRISAEKQQLIGVKMMTVEKAPWSHNLRVLGRITPDETRVYRINAAVSGLIKDALPVTTGSLVKKNELLATFYSSLEYRALVLTYFNSLRLTESGSGNTAGEAPQLSKNQLAQMRKTARDMGQTRDASQIDYYKRSILNAGISAYQLKEMERTGMIPEEIEIRSPVSGFIILRNVTTGFRFDTGSELFRIADLSKVWILADVFESEASFFKPGMRVKMELPYQKKTIYARMSSVLPQFDPATRTLKIRLEADNPGYAMRPDMFVNVDLPVSGPAAIIVPTEAVIDSGLKKTVFVDRGNGYFEPRQVETGRSLGERVEIARGLMPGEKIVVSGNFLIDSETRMQQATAGITGKIGRDPVCGMNIDEDRARAEGNYVEYRGQTYFFCDPREREDFRKEPERYLKSSPGQGAMPPAKTKAKTAVDHTSHGAMKMEEPQGMKVKPHGGMNMAKPKDPGVSSMLPGTAPMRGEKEEGVPFPPVSRNPVQMMPGPSGPGMPDTTSMSPQRLENMLPVPAGTGPTQTLPGQGAGMAAPGSQGPNSMPSQIPGSTFPPPVGAPTQTKP